MTILTNFQPKRRELSSVSLAYNAIVTTTVDHGYEVGYILRLVVPIEYGMHLDYVLAKVLSIPSTTQLEVDLSTIDQAAYVTPSTAPYTEAHCVVLNGIQNNDTSITG